MPDSRRHRSAAPEDAELFGTGWLEALRAACADFAWLLERGYAERAALKLVGDQYSLRARQREAVMRATSPPREIALRRKREAPLEEASGRAVTIDGYNLLTTVESALGHGVLVRGNDGCVRDLASVGGTWRRVAETVPALGICGRFLSECGIVRARWLLDAPISNSGDLRGMMKGLAREHGWSWTVELHPDPDPLLVDSRELVVTADRPVLARCDRWLNLAAALLPEQVPDAWVIDLGAPSPTIRP